MPAPNGRFGVSGGVTRPKVSANLQVLCPTRAAVSRHPRQAAGTLYLCNVKKEKVKTL